MNPIRIGEGWDIHRLVTGRPLVLGGITVPHTHGLLGHSDADALLHAITDALLGAARVPLDTARAAAEVAELAALVAEKGNSNAISDSGVAALLAEAACRGAAYNVRINVAALEDRAAGEQLLAEAAELLARATRASQVAQAAVERALG